VGLAVGDALSAPTQGLKPGDFTPVTGMQGGGVLQLAPGQWSDDTSMALCLAESLIDTGVVDTRDQMNRYRRWLQEGHLSAGGEAVGVRPSVRRAVALAGWRRAPVLGSHDPAQLDVEPLGRCIAAALHAHADFDAAVAAGAEVARVTHQAPLVVDACRLFTGLLQAALAGQERESLLALAVHWPAAPLKPELRELVGRLAIPARRHRKPQQATILTLLEDVLRAFLASPDFATGLLQLVNQGGDSDVAGAAYGQLAGAARGLDAIPAAWRATLPDAERLQRFADQLLRSRGVSLQ
jgi:ADP-ribosylglycohydrolase